MNVLLLDTAFSAGPIYDNLIENCQNVWVMGNRPGDILARRAGSRWICQDYSQIHEVKEFIKIHNIEYVVPGCTDKSLETCVQLGMKHLDDFSTNAMLANKRKFRSLCAKLDLPAPREISIDRLPKAGRYICKPADSFSGRGISIFDGTNHEAAAAALSLAQAASPNQEVLIEPYIEGPLFSYSTFIEGGVPTESFFVYEGSSANPFSVDTSYVDDEPGLHCREALASSLEKIAQVLDLKDGLVHTQFIWDGQKPWIVEMSRRCPGDLYALLIEYSTNYRYAAKYASYFIGIECPTNSNAKKNILRHTVTTDTPQKYGGLKFTPALPVKSIFPLQSIAEEIKDQKGARAGILFCEFGGHNEMIQAVARFLAREVYSAE